MKTWELEEARSRLGELARRAIAHHPQRVTLGDRAVVIVSAEDYATLTFASDLVDFIRRSMSPQSIRVAPADRARSPDHGDTLGPMEDV